MIKGSLGRSWLVSFDSCCPSDWPVQSPAWFWWIMTCIFQASLIALKRIPKGRCVFIYPEDPGIVHADWFTWCFVSYNLSVLDPEIVKASSAVRLRIRVTVAKSPGRVCRLCRPNVTIDVTACWMVQSKWSVEKNTWFLLSYIFGDDTFVGGMISVCWMLWFGLVELFGDVLVEWFLDLYLSPLKAWFI